MPVFWKLSIYIYIYTTINFSFFVAPPSTPSIDRSSRPTTSTCAYSLCDPTPCLSWHKMSLPVHVGLVRFHWIINLYCTWYEWFINHNVFFLMISYDCIMTNIMIKEERNKFNFFSQCTPCTQSILKTNGS